MSMNELLDVKEIKYFNWSLLLLLYLIKGTILWEFQENSLILIYPSFSSLLLILLNSKKFVKEIIFISGEKL